jgi:hypothetical protein
MRFRALFGRTGFEDGICESEDVVSASIEEASCDSATADLFVEAAEDVKRQVVARAGVGLRDAAVRHESARVGQDPGVPMNWDRVLQIDLIPWNIGHEVHMLLLYMVAVEGRVRNGKCAADKPR